MPSFCRLTTSLLLRSSPKAYIAPGWFIPKTYISPGWFIPWILFHYWKKRMRGTVNYQLQRKNQPATIRTFSRRLAFTPEKLWRGKRSRNFQASKSQKALTRRTCPRKRMRASPWEWATDQKFRQARIRTLPSSNLTKHEDNPRAVPDDDWQAESAKLTTL